MKKITIAAIMVIFVIMSISFLVLADDMTPMSIDSVLSEIWQEQGIGSSDPIDVDKVSNAELEKLGDSVMEAMIGNSAMHDQMDIRLGGDGSASLTAFHIKLGYNYLSGYPDGMMGSYQVGKLSNFNQDNNMMGTFGWGDLFLDLCFSFPSF